MPTTSRGYRYPVQGDTGDVPLWMQRLAVDLNSDVGAVANRATALESARAFPWENGGLSWPNGNSAAHAASWSRLQRSGPGARTWTYQAQLVAATGGGNGRWYLAGLPGPGVGGCLINAGAYSAANSNVFQPIYLVWGAHPEGLWFVYLVDGRGTGGPNSRGAADQPFNAGSAIYLDFTMEANV